MDHNQDVTNILIRDRIVDLYASASSSHTRRGTAISVWRKLAGAVLVRFGEAILGEPRTTTAKVTLGVASLSR